MSNLEIQFENIHPICMVLGEIKQQLIEELPHFGHHGLFFQNDEITTGQLNNKTEIKLNLQELDHKFHYDEDSKEYRIWNKIFYDKLDDSKYWIIISVTTEKELFAAIDALRLQIQYIMIPFLIGTTIIAIFISRHMSKPIQNLTKKITQIKKGELDITIPVNGNNEIAELGNAFNVMAKSLRQAQQTSQDYESALSHKMADLKKFNEMLDTSAAISKSDMHGNFTHVNEKFCKLTKYSKEELMGKSHRILKSGYHDDEFYHNMWKKLLAGDVWTGLIKNKAKDGTYFWIKEIILPIRNSKGETIEFLAIHIDIQEQIKKIQSNDV
jgi:PAS domain S-box-containing protein